MIDDHSIVRCLIALTDRGKDSMDLFARNISRKRKHCNLTQRITISTLIRCLIEVFMEQWSNLDLKDIQSEEELLIRIRKLFNHR